MQRYTVVTHKFDTEQKVEDWAIGMEILAKTDNYNFKYWSVQLPNGTYETFCLYVSESYRHGEFAPLKGTRVLCHNNIAGEEV